MGWIIVGFILFIIEVYVLKHTRVHRYIRTGSNTIYGRSSYEVTDEFSKYSMRLWVWILLILCNLLPMVNLVFLVFCIIWYWKRAILPETDEECVIWRFHSNTFDKLIELLNKEL